MKKITASLAAVLMIAATLLPVYGAGEDYDYVTAHVSLTPSTELAILYPAKDVETTDAGYLITGTSNPQQELTINGEPVENRGASGSFAAYMTLEDGANVFTLRQGDASASVTITKGSRNSGTTAVTSDDSDTKPLPQFDFAMKSGSSFKMKCFAPGAAGVTGTVNGKTYELKKDGSYYTGTFKIPEVEGTVDMGTVQYIISYADRENETKTSEGHLYAVGADSTLQIQVSAVSATVFQNADLTGGYRTTAKYGAVDTVTDYSGNMYKLNTGGWISAKSAKPLTTLTRMKNEVEKVSYASDAGGETFLFEGTSYPMYTASRTDDGLTITFHNTSGIGGVDTSSSQLFSGAQVTEKDGDTTIRFTQKNSGSLWGYVVEYGDGQTRLYCKYRPRLAGGDTPLQGITIAVDAGHGGTDVGTLGLTFGHGVTEKEVNYATAVALQKKLELLGANVVMLRENDERVELDPRMRIAQNARVDFSISLHANSVGISSTAANASGVEVYYYEPASKAFAQKIESNIVSATGRKSRGAKYSHFVVTLNSYAPSILVEMGFMLNPGDFDDMCSRQGIYNTVTAISDGIVSTLQA